MTLRRRTLIVLAVLVVSALPLLIRGGMRFYVLGRLFSKVPGARERVALMPTKRVLTLQPALHTVDLGYATFDIGSTNPVSLEAAGSGASVLVTNGDIRVAFLPPFGVNAGNNQAADLTSLPANAGRKYPHAMHHLQLMENDFLSAEMQDEETHLLPISKVLFMSSDSFLLYSSALIRKATLLGSAKEVQFFESPNVRGIMRIEGNDQGHQVATVHLSFPDGARNVGLRVTMSETSSREIAPLLDPLIRSFRFTADNVDDREEIEALILRAGIPLRKSDEQSGDGRPP